MTRRMMRYGVALVAAAAVVMHLAACWARGRDEARFVALVAFFTFGWANNWAGRLEERAQQRESAPPSSGRGRLRSRH